MPRQQPENYNYWGQSQDSNQNLSNSADLAFTIPVIIHGKSTLGMFRQIKANFHGTLHEKQARAQKHKRKITSGPKQTLQQNSIGLCVRLEFADKASRWRGLEKAGLKCRHSPDPAWTLHKSALASLQFIPNRSIKSTVTMNILYSYDIVSPIQKGFLAKAETMHL